MNPKSLEGKRQTVAAVFRSICDKPYITRRELGESLNISTSTVTLAVGQLQQLGLVDEQGSTDTAMGRKTQLLTLNAFSRSVLCIQLDAQRELSLRLCALDGTILKEAHRAAPHGQEDFLPAIIAGSHGLLAENTLPLAAVVLILPGVVRPDGIASVPAFGWDGMDIAGPLAAEMQVPVYCDTVLAIIGDYEARRVSPVQRQLYLSLEPGVGLSVYEEGKRLKSRNGIYGELGHICLHEDGPLCYCGNRGCMEYYCGVSGILDRYGKGTLEDFLGDREADALRREVAQDLGRTLVTLCNLMDPERVVVSGRLWQDAAIRNAAIALARSRMLPRPHGIEFCAAQLSYDRWEVGSVQYGLDRWLLERMLLL